MKIETGCLAIVISSCAGNTGKSVKVGRFIGAVSGFEGNDRWEVDKPMRTSEIFFNETVYHQREKQLMRIDDFEGDKELETGKELIQVF